jgi:hypothetical protein
MSLIDQSAHDRAMSAAAIVLEFASPSEERGLRLAEHPTGSDALSTFIGESRSSAMNRSGVSPCVAENREYT